MTKQDFHVGQTVYLFHIENSRHEVDIERRIIETKVVSVGKKYLAVDYWGRMQFDMTNNFREKTIYSPNFELYLTKEDIYRMVDANRLRAAIRDKLSRTLNIIPLEGLQEISATIDKYTG